MEAFFASWDTLISIMLGLWTWENFHVSIKLKIEIFFISQVFLQDHIY